MRTPRASSLLCKMGAGFACRSKIGNQKSKMPSYRCLFRPDSLNQIVPPLRASRTPMAPVGALSVPAISAWGAEALAKAAHSGLTPRDSNNSIKSTPVKFLARLNARPHIKSPRPERGAISRTKQVSNSNKETKTSTDFRIAKLRRWTAIR